jgi:hypothetical protein
MPTKSSIRIIAKTGIEIPRINNHSTVHRAVDFHLSAVIFTECPPLGIVSLEKME